MAEFGAEFLGQRGVVIDHQADAGSPRYRENGFGQAADFVEGGVFGAELDEVSAAVAELPGDELRRAAMQVSGINKGVEPAFG
jgi:hypothetical protein